MRFGLLQCVLRAPIPQGDLRGRPSVLTVQIQTPPVVEEGDGLHAPYRLLHVAYPQVHLGPAAVEDPAVWFRRRLGEGGDERGSLRGTT